MSNNKTTNQESANREELSDEQLDAVSGGDIPVNSAHNALDGLNTPTDQSPPPGTIFDA